MFYTEIQDAVVFSIVGFVVYLLVCAIIGYITHILGENRGFTRTQFWWGFFLGILGLCMVALMPTYRVYDDEEKDTPIVRKRRELDHYAPALRPKVNNTNANKPKEKNIEENVEKPKTEKINDNKYWGNDIDSIIGNQEDK